MAKKKANGEGSLMPKKSGGYELQISIGVDAVTGKTKRKSFSGKTIKEVRAKEKDYYASLKNGTLIEPNKILFGEWMDNWLKNFKFGLVEARTYDYYESHVKVHLNRIIFVVRKIVKKITIIIKNVVTFLVFFL